MGLLLEKGKHNLDPAIAEALSPRGGGPIGPVGFKPARNLPVSKESQQLIQTFKNSEAADKEASVDLVLLLGPSSPTLAPFARRPIPGQATPCPPLTRGQLQRF